MTDEQASVHFSITPGFSGDETLELGFPEEYEDELLALIDEAGLQHEPVLVHSDAAGTTFQVVTVLGPEGIAAVSLAVASIVKTIVRRNVGKRIFYDGVEIEGYSEKDAEKFFRNRAAELEAKAKARKKKG